MSREIKFRAWDIKWEFMTAEVSLKDLAEGFAGIYGEDKIVMQYTGLKDKNGKEIFESDVLKIYYEGNQRSYLKKVKWLNDAINKGRWDALDNCVFTSCEVVGNIFENPELITEVKNG